MRRGDICVIDLDPARATEARKSRPAVVVSNDGANSTATRLGRGVVTVYPFQVLLPASLTGLSATSKAQAEQVRSVDVERVRRRVGSVPEGLMMQLDL